MSIQHVELITVREINEAVYENTHNGKGQVYASFDDDDKVRIIRAKTVNGVLEVKCLNSGLWRSMPLEAWHE